MQSLYRQRNWFFIQKWGNLNPLALGLSREASNLRDRGVLSAVPRDKPTLVVNVAAWQISAAASSLLLEAFWRRQRTTWQNSWSPWQECRTSPLVLLQLQFCLYWINFSALPSQLPSPQRAFSAWSSLCMDHTFLQSTWIRLIPLFERPLFLALEALPIEPNTILLSLRCYPVWASEGSLRENYNGSGWDTDIGWGIWPHAPSIFEVLWEELLLTSDSPLMATPAVLLVFDTQNLASWLSLPPHTSLIIPYKSLSHLFSPFSSHSPQPISRALKIFLLGSRIALIWPLTLSSTSSPFLPQSSLCATPKIIFLKHFLRMSHFCFKKFPLTPCCQINPHLLGYYLESDFFYTHHLFLILSLIQLHST